MQKFRLSNQKVRAWLIISAAFFAFFLIIPKTAFGALTSPAPIVTGSQYGKSEGSNYDLGKTADNRLYAYQEKAWQPENQKNSKILYLAPTAGKQALFAGHVNTSSTVCNVADTNPICQLEFRVSFDSGVTWSQALTGSTLWLPIMGKKFEYTLYSDPNGKDIWVSYTYAFTPVPIPPNPPSLYQEYTKSKIVKLSWVESSSLWQTVDEGSVPAIGIDPSVNMPANLGGPCSGNLNLASPVGVGAQLLASGVNRIWAMFACTNGSRRYFKIYNDDFFNSTSWTGPAAGSAFASTSLISSGSRSNGSEPKGEFFPVGNKKIPAFVYSNPSILVNPTADCTGTPGSGLTLQLLQSQYSSQWMNEVSLGDYAGLLVINTGTGGTSCGYVYTCSPYPSCSPLQVAYQFDFQASAAATGDYTARMVAAYEGGKDKNNLDYVIPGPHENQIRVKYCDITIGVSPANSSATCLPAAEDNNYKLGDTYKAPSVGFYDQFSGHPKAWVAARNTTTGRLNLFEETALLPKDWTRQDLQGTNTAFNPSLVSDVPTGFNLNSGLPPVMWSQFGATRIAISANIGGSSIGGPENANPVYGWGWSSSFGWLSLNCANKWTGVNIVCDPAPPTQQAVFGLGIGLTNNTTPFHYQTVDPEGYRLGGYAWSPNAGYLSFERTESVTATNTYGNPPGQAYNNNLVDDGTIPLAKYDPTSQKLFGWARFFNLCDLDPGTKKCTNDSKGWVRLRGYWHIEPDPNNGILDGACNQCDFITLQSSAQADYFGECVDSDKCTAVIGDEFFTYAHEIGTNTLSVVQTPPENGPIRGTGTPYPSGTPVYKVTGQEYGVDAYWNGSYYELNGWAWSKEYGWIQFKPLIFIGYAWLETLFGNIYSGTDIMLPKPENKSGTAIKCDYNGDGTFDEDCAVSTYRIEANGSITGLQMSGTSYSNPGATSNFSGTGQPFGGFIDSDGFFVRSRGDSQITYPSISDSTVIYRNALGKLDLAGLIGFVNEGSNLQYLDGSPAKTVKIGQNRFGNTLLETSATILPTGLTTTDEWTTSLLQGLKFSTTNDSQWAINVPPLQRLNSQVIHVSGNLTVDGGTGKLSVLDRDAQTLTVDSGAFPRPSAQYGTDPAYTQPTCAGCALVIDPGGTNEEYVSYTSYNSATKVFSGVNTITGVKDHSSGNPVVRSTWRLPYFATEPKAQTTTIIVDGNLQINYNIIGSQPSTPLKIRDVPTIAFIVKGDVTIDPAVNKLTGAYIVMGTNDTVGGSFSTGNDRSSCPAGTGTEVRCNPLVLDGLVMARQFNLERYGSKDLSLPGEQIRYDTRLFLNPPPGLEDVSKALSNPVRAQP